MDTLFISTAIPFVNGAPHLGHVLEYVQTDVLARHARARGDDVYFLTGTDEHAAKNVQAAAPRRSTGRRVRRRQRDAVSRPGRRARRLVRRLHPHERRPSAPPVVREIWERCARHGDLYRAEYEARYCAGCEEFRDEPCPEHDAPLEVVREDNWFFRLSRYAPEIRARDRIRRAPHRAARTPQRGARIPRRRRARRQRLASTRRVSAAGGSRCPAIPTNSCTCGSTRWRTTPSAPGIDRLDARSTGART